MHNSRSLYQSTIPPVWSGTLPLRQGEIGLKIVRSGWIEIQSFEIDGAPQDGRASFMHTEAPRRRRPAHGSLGRIQRPNFPLRNRSDFPQSPCPRQMEFPRNRFSSLDAQRPPLRQNKSPARWPMGAGNRSLLRKRNGKLARLRTNRSSGRRPRACSHFGFNPFTPWIRSTS